MKNQFDELTKGLAQSVTRRAALKKFSVGLAGMALACFGLANKSAAAQQQTNICGCKNCKTTLPTNHPAYVFCRNICGFPCRPF